MAQLIVRNLDARLVDRLERRAAANGRSVEEEHRRILEQVLAPPQASQLKDLLLAFPDVGTDSDFERPRDFGRAGSL